MKKWRKTSMKIAILAPIDHKVEQNSVSEINQNIHRLISYLTKNNIDVTLFATKDSTCDAELKWICPSSIDGMNAYDTYMWQALHISELFESSKKYDLIHNFMGSIALTHLALSITPILTTIYGIDIYDFLDIYRKYNNYSNMFYVSAVPNFELDIDIFTSIIDRDNDDYIKVVSKYIKVYEEVIKRCKRVDSRPWGYYEVLIDDEDHKVKRITVYPGKRLSLQKHRHRREHWYFVRGKANVTIDDKDIPVSKCSSTNIPIEAVHRITNTGDKNCVFIEIQTGDYFGEDDIERLEDDFGRAE